MTLSVLGRDGHVARRDAEDRHLDGVSGDPPPRACTHSTHNSPPPASCCWPHTLMRTQDPVCPPPLSAYARTPHMTPPAPPPSPRSASTTTHDIPLRLRSASRTRCSWPSSLSLTSSPPCTLVWGLWAVLARGRPLQPTFVAASRRRGEHQTKRLATSRSSSPTRPTPHTFTQVRHHISGEGRGGGGEH